MSNKRSRYFEIIFYLEDDPLNVFIDRLNNEYNILYILHDKDVYEEDGEDHVKGEFKKPHYHILFVFQNARSKKSFCEELGYRENLCTPITNLNRFMLYMIHYGEDKAQYSIDSCKGSPLLIEKLSKLIKQQRGEQEEVAQILDYINDATYIITLDEMLYYCLNNSLWSTWRRNYSILKTFLFNHNVKIDNLNKARKGEEKIEKTLL